MIKPYWQDKLRTLYNHDCRNMPELADNSIQCCVTSPPYWGLRKYAGEQNLIWGSKSDCEHEWGNGEVKAINYMQGNPEFARPHRENKSFNTKTNTCSLCGAWRGAFGLEPTPELYIAHSIEILREIRRVLRKDGVVFWNIGDSYSGYKGSHYGDTEGNLTARTPVSNGERFDIGHPMGNIKPKDMCLIPERFKIAAQEDGWYIRSTIIWSKNNPMPESVTDRPTESHEYIIMLTKSARYYWDQEAVREPNTWIENRPNGMIRQAEIYREQVKHNDPSIGGGGTGFQGHSGCFKADGTPLQNPAGRNLRSVWEFPTQPYREAHFATFPEELPERCIKAATPEYGCCAECGTPWERIIKTEYRNDTTKDGRPAKGNNKPERDGETKTFASGERTRRIDTTIGWHPSCKCQTDKPPVPAIVLDSFSGSGTTMKVAAELNRQAVGYELSTEYCDLIIQRNKQGVLL